MKAPIDWLKDFVNIRISPEDLVDKLTMSGTEVSALEFHGGDIEKVVVGKVKSIIPHEKNPDLLVCQVDIGKNIIQVITESKGFGPGDKVPIALEGATLAKGFKVKHSELHGIESFGSLCCGHDLGMEFTEEVLKLPKDCKVGVDIQKVVGLGGYVLSIDILPNRGDCLSIIGVAREIATITKKTIREEKVKVPHKSMKSASQMIKVEVKAKDLCPRYMARVVEDIQIKESPDWLKNRLLLAGLRPINNVVDITNYLLIETGQPMHAFDLKYIKDSKIIIRKASKNEEIVTLDGQKHKLDEENLVIADSQKPIALAGVMGAENSEVKNNTTTVVLESAYFNPVNINRTSRTKKIKTESSMRFERGVDWDQVAQALDKAAEMLTRLAGGKVCRGVIDVKQKDMKKLNIKLRIERMNKILGITVSMREAKEILERLGFKIIHANRNVNTLLIEIPYHRALDVTREIDLIEEIARVHGYEYIPTTMANTSFENKMVNHSLSFLRDVRKSLISYGLNEIQSYSMISPKDLIRLNLTSDDIVKLANPLSEEESVLRKTLLPNILNTIQYNQFRQIPNISIFEMGTVFSQNGKEVIEKQCLAAAIVGSLSQNELYLKEFIPDFFAVKGIIENLFKAIGVNKIEFKSEPNKFTQPGLEANIYWNNNLIGYFGALHPKIVNNYEIKGDVFYFEIDLDGLLNNLPFASRKYIPLPKFPAVYRDIALMVSTSVEASEITKIILKIGAPLAESVEVFDYYKGKPIPTGMVNLAFRTIYRTKDRTLTDEEVNTKQNEIISILEEKYKAQIRR